MFSKQKQSNILYISICLLICKFCVLLPPYFCVCIMLKKQKLRTQTYAFLDLCREGKKDITLNRFQNKSFKCKENEILKLFRVKVRKILNVRFILKFSMINNLHTHKCDFITVGGRLLLNSVGTVSKCHISVI